MAGGSAERSWSAGESGGSEALVALSEAVTRANESGSDVEPKHASNLESAIASLERSSIVPLNQEDRAIAWMHCFTLWNCCVRLRSEHRRCDTITARIRHACARIAAIPGEQPPRTRSGDTARKPLEFFYKAAAEWHSLSKHEKAETALSASDEFATALEEHIRTSEHADLEQSANDLTLLLHAHLERAAINAAIKQPAVSINLLMRCHRLLPTLAACDASRHSAVLQEVLTKCYELGKDAVSNNDSRSAIETLEPAIALAEQVDREQGSNECVVQVLRALGIALSDSDSSDRRCQMMNTSKRLLEESPWDEVGCVLLVKAQKEELGELQSLVGQMMQHEGLNSDIKLAVFQEVVDARAFKIATEVLPMLCEQPEFQKKHEALVSLVSATIEYGDESLLDHLLHTISKASIEHSLYAGNDQSSARSVCSMFWNAGVSKYRAGACKIAKRMLEACLHFFPETEHANRSAASRLVALCAFLSGNFGEAHDFAELSKSEEYQSAQCVSAGIEWLLLKIELRQGNCSEESVTRLRSASGFSEDHMFLVIREASNNENYRIAASAAESLLQYKMEQGEGAISVELLCGAVELASRCQEQMEKGGAVVPGAIFQKVINCLHSFGCEGLETSSASGGALDESLEWLSARAWNSAVDFANDGKYEDAALCFKAAARVPQYKTGAKGRATQNTNLCLLLSVSTSLLTIDSGVGKDDENRFLKDAEDTLADVLLDGETEVAKLQTFFEMLSFEINVRRTRKTNVMKKVKELETAQPDEVDEKMADHVMRMASVCDRNAQLRELTFRLYNVAAKHLDACESADVKESELQQLPYAVRRSVILSSDENRTKHVKVAEQYVTKHAARWPKDEATFLVATSWNHGTMLAKLGKHSEALPVLESAMSMLKSVASAQTACASLFLHERNDMEAAVNAVQERAAPPVSG